jgi:hypothetical protein
MCKLLQQVPSGELPIDFAQQQLQKNGSHDNLSRPSVNCSHTKKNVRPISTMLAARAQIGEIGPTEQTEPFYHLEFGW